MKDKKSDHLFRFNNMTNTIAMATIMSSKPGVPLTLFSASPG
jgi:hypothetical protein